MSVVALEVAQKEIQSFLAFQGVTDAQKLKWENSISKIVEAVQTGMVKIDTEKNIITQTLKFPFGKERQIKELTFQPQITVGDVQTHMIGAKDDDPYATAMAHICAATGQPKVIIQQLNNKDYKISDSIILFFML